MLAGTSTPQALATVAPTKPEDGTYTYLHRSPSPTNCVPDGHQTGRNIHHIPWTSAFTGVSDFPSYAHVVVTRRVLVLLSFGHRGMFISSVVLNSHEILALIGKTWRQTVGRN